MDVYSNSLILCVILAAAKIHLLMKLLENKVALVTGASRGIGEAIAIKFAEHGANVAFTYLSSDERAKALEEKLTALGVKAKAYKSDAGEYAAAEQLDAFRTSLISLTCIAGLSGFPQVG